MNLKEAAAYLGRNVDEVKRLAGQGLIPATKLDNGHWFFYEKDLSKWLENHPKETFKLAGIDIESLVADKTYKEVAEELGVTVPAIGYHMRKLGIRRYKKND